MIGLRAWINDINIEDQIQDLYEMPIEVKDAFHHQTAIRWGQITRGKLSTKWIDIVKTHLHNYQVSSSKITPTRWATNLITIVWQGVLNAWDNRNK